MRTLALDHGSKRIGVAISDELGIIAQPLEYIPAQPREAFFQRLLALLAEKKVAEILVGMPYNMDGSCGPATEKVEGFIEELKENTSLPIQTCDESLTTCEAEEFLINARSKRNKRKQVIDKMAAAVLLQGYLNSKPS